MKEHDVLVVPTGLSEPIVVGQKIYICPDEKAYNHKECVFLAPYARQQVTRYAPILKRIRNVKFILRNESIMPKCYKDSFLPNIPEFQDEKLRLAVNSWYLNGNSWESDCNRVDGIQIYILGDWIELKSPKRPRNVSDNRFMGHRYASILGLYNEPTLDGACGML